MYSRNIKIIHYFKDLPLVVGDFYVYKVQHLPTIDIFVKLRYILFEQLTILSYNSFSSVVRISDSLLVTR